MLCTVKLSRTSEQKYQKYLRGCVPMICEMIDMSPQEC